MMKNRILYFLAIIGTLTIVLKLYFGIEREIHARNFVTNCQNVKVGMTLSKAREIMGDLKYQYWTQDDRSGEIIISKSNTGKIKYILEYDMVFAGSENPKITFDPNTLLVTEVFCNE